MAATELLRADGITFGYAGMPVLRDVSFSVSSGEFVALVGPNGSGKSTLIKLLLGMLEPDAGRSTLFGQSPSEFKERGRLGYVPQRPALAPETPATVEEVVAAGRLSTHRWWTPARAIDREEVDHALASVGLENHAKRPVKELSGGQQQRAFIARAFASVPDLLVLDEPIAGVDAESQALFRDSLMHLIEDHGSGVLLISHELSAVAEDVDRVVVLKETVIFDGPPAQLSAEGVSLGVHREDLPRWLEGLR